MVLGGFGVGKPWALLSGKKPLMWNTELQEVHNKKPTGLVVTLKGPGAFDVCFWHGVCFLCYGWMTSGFRRQGRRGVSLLLLWFLCLHFRIISTKQNQTKLQETDGMKVPVKQLRGSPVSIQAISFKNKNYCSSPTPSVPFRNEHIQIIQVSIFSPTLPLVVTTSALHDSPGHSPGGHNSFVYSHCLQ